MNSEESESLSDKKTRIMRNARLNMDKGSRSRRMEEIESKRRETFENRFVHTALIQLKYEDLNKFAVSKLKDLLMSSIQDLQDESVDKDYVLIKQIKSLIGSTNEAHIREHFSQLIKEKVSKLWGKVNELPELGHMERQIALVLNDLENGPENHEDQKPDTSRTTQKLTQAEVIEMVLKKYGLASQSVA